ncbi:hypothetical protein T03_3958 [Trichinella britovi]|uniref:Uncharacterized protein n=1 Tax=Trichinella britovi TaxID=45882 RepID=A0A0V1CV40_TRIBR|nr:hypothetical protein T03_3958 [Trichinella britovi]
MGTLLDCWGRPHPTLEKRVYKAGNLSRARYSAHFDTKLSSISLLAEKFNKIDVINLLIFLYWEVLGLTSQCSQ